MLPCTRNLQEQTIGCWLCQREKKKKKHFLTLKTDTFNTPNLPLECPLGRSQCGPALCWQPCVWVVLWARLLIWPQASLGWVQSHEQLLQLSTVSKLHDELNTRPFFYIVNHCFLNFDFPFFAFYQLVPIFFTYFLPPSGVTVEIFLYNDWHLITFLQLIISLFEGNEAKKRANGMPLGGKEA